MSLTNITINLDQDSAVFRAGESISGHVCVSSTTAIDAGLLNIRIVGTETASVKATTFLGGLKSKKRQERVVYKDHNTLNDCSQETVESGDTFFYFVFQLPTDLLPSMQLDAGEDGFCSIAYAITADLGNATESLYPTIVGACTTATDTQPKPQFFPIKVNGSRSKGVLMVGAKVDKKLAGKRQRVTVSLGCANYSDLNIRNIDIHLVEVVQWRQNKQSMERTILLSEDSDVRLPGVSTCCREKRSAADARRALTDITSALSNPRCSVDVPIPRRARVDCKSDLVQVSHYIEVVFCTRDGSSFPRVKIPLEVVDETTTTTGQRKVPKSLLLPSAFKPKSTLSLDTVDTCSIYSN